MTDAPTVMRFREARADDAERIAVLHADSWRRHYRGAFADSYLDADIVAERLAAWSARLAEPTGYVTVLAEEGGDIAGIVHVILDDDAEWGSLVDNLHVDHRRQRSGVGTALLAHASRAILERAASPAVYLWVLEQNANARRFYRARGGVTVGRAPVPPPGGVPSRLNGTPFGLRIAWPHASALAEQG